MGLSRTHQLVCFWPLEIEGWYMTFELSQIFTGEYPPEAAAWCNQRGDCYITELDTAADGTRRFQIVAIPEPTEAEKTLAAYQAELQEKQAWLSAHDYIGTKIATGRATTEDYADEIATMTEYAARVEELRTLIAELEGQE